LLISKNNKYGNSALDPIRVFSKATTKEQLLVRIDDKLNRILTLGAEDKSEDTILDLAGYLVLLIIKIRSEQTGHNLPDNISHTGGRDDSFEYSSNED
tara:strand:+ start:424 stop:717 length:294 start_codon:yes stop_codon:yes gene_type:complete